MRVSPDDHALVRDAIREAERRTGADFVCVLARNASAYEFYPLAWASLAALALPWLLLAVTTWPFAEILLVQLVTFAVTILVLSTPGLRRFVVPRRVQRLTAHRAAAEQFFIHGLAGTPHRRGVLLFVAHDERYARVLADDGAVDIVAPEQWRKAVDLLVAEARSGRHASGFVHALQFCADILAPSRPEGGPDRPNALPDKFLVLG